MLFIYTFSFYQTFKSKYKHVLLLLLTHFSIQLTCCWYCKNKNRKTQLEDKKQNNKKDNDKLKQKLNLFLFFLLALNRLDFKIIIIINYNC